MKSKFHLAALEWAEAGFYVFPCRVGRKEPAIDNNLELATRDAATIDRWWSEMPDANIGCTPDASGNLVIDVDPPLGFVTLQALEAANEPLPPTLTMTTPRGGIHLWFDGKGKSSAGTERNGLGPKLDTRGEGGYVLMPPSVIGKGQYTNNPEGGCYAVKENIETAELPAWVQTRLVAERDHQLSGTRDLDTPENLGRIAATLDRLVAEGDVAIEGSGGDDRTYRLCCEVLDLGASPEKALDLIDGAWNAACIPPWSRDDLAAKLAHACEYRQNDLGAYGVRPAAETFAAAAEALGSENTVGGDAGHGSGRPRFHFRSIVEQRNRPPTEWLLSSIIPKKSIGFMYGDSDSFKTFLALDMCLGLSAGLHTFGCRANGRVETAYIAGEGPAEIETKRRPAWQLVRGVTDDIAFFTVDEMPEASDEVDVRIFVEAAVKQGRKPQLVVIDTAFWFGAGLNLNDGKDVSKMMKSARFIRDNLNTAVMLIHHIGKDEDRGMTGSRHLFGASDFVVSVRRLPDTLFVKAQMTKQKDGEKRMEPWYFQGHAVGSSLVFDECEVSVFAAAADAMKLVTAKKVGAALKALGAFGAAKGVTLSVVASEMTRGTQVASSLIERGMKREAEDALALYHEGVLWFLPGSS